VTVRSVRLAPEPGRSWCALPSPLDGARCLISLRQAGNMSLKETARRRAFFESVGVGPDRVLALRQVHSLRVLAAADVPAGGDAAALPEADGIVSGDAIAPLTVTVADCLPIFVGDPRTGARALVHSGWKGTGIVAEAIARMAALHGARAADLRVVIGPGIGGCCYDVPRERYELFRARYGGGAAIERDGRTYLDLRQANVVLLERLGVADVAVVEDCTACTAELASFRVLGTGAYVGMVAVMAPA
jgi:polyphenol oxidase